MDTLTPEEQHVEIEQVPTEQWEHLRDLPLTHRQYEALWDLQQGDALAYKEQHGNTKRALAVRGYVALRRGDGDRIYWDITEDGLTALENEWRVRGVDIG